MKGVSHVSSVSRSCELFKEVLLRCLEHSNKTVPGLRRRTAGQAERNAALAKAEVQRLKRQLTNLQHSQSSGARPSGRMHKIDRHELSKIPS